MPLWINRPDLALWVDSNRDDLQLFFELQYGPRIDIAKSETFHYLLMGATEAAIWLVPGGWRVAPFVPTLVLHELGHWAWDSAGLGASSGTTPTRTVTSSSGSKRVPESRKGRKTNSAHGFSSGKAPTARGKCPKGHYWSYKKKKCVKSKFK